MKIEILAGALAEATGRMRSVTPNRSTVPHTGCFLLESFSGGLRVTATDFTRRAWTRIPVELTGDFRACLPADALTSLVKAFPGDAKVTIEIDGASCVISSGRSRYKLHGLDPDDFPAESVQGKEHRFRVPREWLDVGLAQQVAFASPGGNRLALYGVTLTFMDGMRVRTFASDTHRLHRVFRDFDHGFEERRSVIIPLETCTLASSALPQEDVEIALGGSSVRFLAGDTCIWSALIECTAMDPESLIPPWGEFSFSAHVVETKDILKRMRAMVDRNKKSQPIRVTWGGGEVVFAMGPIADESSESLPADVAMSGTMAVDFAYFCQAIDAMPGERWGSVAQNVKFNLLASPGHPAVDHVIMGMNSE